MVASGVLFGVLGLFISTAFDRQNKDQKKQTSVFRQEAEGQLTKKETTIQSKVSSNKNKILKTKLHILPDQVPESERKKVDFYFLKNFWFLEFLSFFFGAIPLSFIHNYTENFSFIDSDYYVSFCFS